jgi:hypothetical protein
MVRLLANKYHLGYYKGTPTNKCSLEIQKAFLLHNGPKDYNNRHCFSFLEIESAIISKS